MRKLALVFACLGLVACSIFGGAKAPDPLAGWGGLWVGDYSGGGYGALEMELSVDTAGAPIGVARFDRGYGLESYRMLNLVLTADSIVTELDVEGMAVEIAGSREAERATGTYTVGSAGALMDSGSWTLTRRPPER